MNKAPKIARLIHDNFWIVLPFAFSQPIVGKIMDPAPQGVMGTIRLTIIRRSLSICRCREALPRPWLIALSKGEDHDGEGIPITAQALS